MESSGEVVESQEDPDVSLDADIEEESNLNTSNADEIEETEEDPDDPPYEEEDAEGTPPEPQDEDVSETMPSSSSSKSSTKMSKKRKTISSSKRISKPKKRRKKAGEKYDESLDDALLEAQLAEGIFDDDVSMSGSFCSGGGSSKKKKKTVSELTQEWGLNYNIEMEYTESDYEECVDHKSYSTRIKPLLVEDYPDLSPSQVTTLLKAFWHDFKEKNPKLQKKSRPNSSAAVSPVSERKVKPLKIKLSGPQRGVHAATSEDEGPDTSYVVTGGENSDGTNEDNTNEEAGDSAASVAPKVMRKAKIKTGLGHGKTKKKKKVLPPTQPVSAMATTSAQGLIRSTSKWKKGNGGDEDEFDTNHQDYCDECHAGGDILLCDNCPKAYHLVCLNPPLEKAPEGRWVCATCEKEGVTAGSGPAGQETADEDAVIVSDEDDEHQEYCKICRQGGQLLCCDKCPFAYHLGCLNPPLLEIPDGEWVCPRCSVGELQKKATKILFWRWQYPSDEESAPISGKVGSKKPWREFLCKWEYLSYWKCEWVTETQLEISQPGMLRSYMKKMGEMEEPPPIEDGSSFGKKRHDKSQGGNKDKLLEQKFYRFGIKPEWLQIHRIINHWETGTKKMFYLVKWRDLPHTECSWEAEDDCPAADFKKFVTSYKLNREKMLDIHMQKMEKRGLATGEKQKKKKSSKSKHEERVTEKPIETDLKVKFEKQPEYLDKTGGTLHEYQLEGLNWLRFSYSQGTDTILADEMGLGKTIQTITFLYSLYKEGHSNGPFLVAAPLSTIINWEREFEFWAPEFYVVTYVGTKDARAIIRENELTLQDERVNKMQMKIKEGTALQFHVLLTSYELISMDCTTLQSIEWSVLVVDEAHRLKSNQSKFFRVLDQYKIEYRLLLTGTPLQNNLEELYHLLNFLSKDKFGSIQEFLDMFSDISKEEQVKKLHDLLASHMLRRLKQDVLKDLPSKSEFIVRVDLSSLQKKYYRHILTRNFEALNSKGGGANVSLLNIMMELKKCANHPYLFNTAYEEAPKNLNGVPDGTMLIKNCGKLVLLEKMLKILKDTGHRVLIFSQMTRVLDILEDFCEYLGYKYERVDGAITGQTRQEAIDRFNSPNAEQFIFLLSTRAGGLGINLATADTVIIYDSDWNPHNDIQALSRAHRIGQANKVMIYRFVTRNTVEERITQVAKKKMMLTHLVVRPGMHNKGAAGGGANMSKQELDDILKFGTEDLFKDEETASEGDGNKEDAIVYDEAAIRQLLDRSQEGIEEKNKLLDDYLSSFKVASYIVKEVPQEEEEEEDTTETEVIKQEEAAPTTDPDYWEKLLRHHYEQEQENQAKSLGKGKRVRKQVNYYTDGIAIARPEEEVEWTHDADEYDSEFSGDHNDPEDQDNEFGPDGNQALSEKRRRRHKDYLPALLAKVNGQIEVFGFNSRQRKAFYNAVLRWGMPPNDPSNSTWLVRDLRGKSETEFRAYSSMFLRHLCEPAADNAEAYADGVPREGIQRQPVLTRIGIMSLIKKKVVEFEGVNGKLSMPELIPEELRSKLEDPSGNFSQSGPQTPVKQGKCNSNKSSRSSTPLPVDKNAIGDIEKVKKEESATNTETGVASKDTLKTASDVASVTSSSTASGSASTGASGKDLDKRKSLEDTAKMVSEMKQEPQKKLQEIKKAEDHGHAGGKRRFMFNIADGGFTELHTLWINEERAIKANPQKETEIWHRRHDYWLLCGIVQHGYGRYQDIQQDMRYHIINEPFKQDAGKPNFVDIKNRFISKRFKLLEQALVIEEQLRRAAYMQIGGDDNPMSASLQTLNARFSELESLADSHQHLSKESLAGNKSANAVLHKVLLQLDELLSEMRADAAKLPTSLTRITPVTQRLQLSERSILSRLLQYKPSPSGANPSAPHTQATPDPQGAASSSSSSASVAPDQNNPVASSSMKTLGPPKCEDYINSDGYSGPFFAPIGAIPYKAAPPAGASSSSAAGNIPSVTTSASGGTGAPAVVKSEGSVQKPVVIE